MFLVGNPLETEIDHLQLQLVYSLETLKCIPLGIQEPNSGSSSLVILIWLLKVFQMLDVSAKGCSSLSEGFTKMNVGLIRANVPITNFAEHNHYYTLKYVFAKAFARAQSSIKLCHL